MGLRETIVCERAEKRLLFVRVVGFFRTGVREFTKPCHAGHGPIDAVVEIGFSGKILTALPVFTGNRLLPYRFGPIVEKLGTIREWEPDYVSSIF